MGVIVAHTVDVDDRVAVHTERGAAAHIEADGHTHLAVGLEHLHTADASVEDVGQVRSRALIHEPLHVHLVDLRSDGLSVTCAGDTGGDDHLVEVKLLHPRCGVRGHFIVFRRVRGKDLRLHAVCRTDI